MIIKLGLLGASGRLGRSIAALALQDPSFRVEAALTHVDSPFLGKDLGTLLGRRELGTFLSADLRAKEVDLYLDVSLPIGFSLRLEQLVERKKPLVIGTTGISDGEFRLLELASRSIPIFYTANFSLGLFLLRKLASQAARLFSPTGDIDLVEKHHVEKKDAPSGSARLLADTIREAHPQKKGPSIHSIRSGKIVGEHEISFNTAEEQLVLSHKAHTRELFAKGALAAAKFLVGKPAGLYGMEELTENISI